MEKIVTGIIVITFFSIFASTNVDTMQLFEFVELVIHFAFEVVDGIVQIIIAILEALM